MDFTLQIYQKLILSIEDAGYVFQTFENFSEKPAHRVAVLRHDVDRIPENALRMALIESEMGVQASYFFRVVNHVWDTDIMKKIVSLGHEVAYHYEDLTITKGNYEQAIAHFEKNLNKFREIYPSKTICMHGSPMSRWDNRKLWEKYDYRSFGIIAEPYFDVDYSELFYITDTGRAWNNEKSNVRDRVASPYQIDINSTQHMIDLIEKDKLPKKIMINTHPQRWFNPGVFWFKELVMQNVKNVVKLLIPKRDPIEKY
jgi:hypothetical protein